MNRDKTKPNPTRTPDNPSRRFDSDPRLPLSTVGKRRTIELSLPSGRGMPDWCEGCRKVRDIAVVVSEIDLCGPCSELFFKALATAQAASRLAVREGRAA